jgi:hypothetical protein
MKPDAEWLLVEIRKLRAQLGAVASTGGLRTPAHAATHADAGSDPVNVTTLDGFPGDASLYLDGTGAFTTPGGGGSPGPPTPYKTIGCVIGDGTNVITAGEKGIARADMDGTIVASVIYATDAAVTPGDILVDVWAEHPSNHYPPISTDNIMGSSLLELNGADYAEDTTLTGVTLGVTAGQMFRFVVPEGSPGPSGVLQVVALLVVDVS